jgi:DNA-binding response OmpR family regulator
VTRVLICDDHELMREMIGRLLREDGHEVVEAATVAGALVELAAAACDAIILDLHLRGESGLGLVARLRADAALGSVPVVLVSGEFDGPDERQASRYGVAAVLPKPFEPEELTATLRAATGRA